MKAINTFADNFEKKVLNFIYKIRKSISPSSVATTTEKIQSVNDQYELLIKEYELIKQNKSNLPKKQRDLVTLKIAHLISKNHIKVN